MTINRSEARRQTSQTAYGQRYRLELMLEILKAEDGIFTLTDMAKALGTSPSNLQGPVECLLDLAMVSRLPNPEPKSVYYLRNESAGWAWALELDERPD